MGQEKWPDNLELAVCEACDWVYLTPAGADHFCARCGQAGLTPLDPEADRPVYTQPPELVVPFSLPQERLETQLSRFARAIWFAPEDLQEERLAGRLRPLYLPMWLVDADVAATWQAEVGFNYQVVSHRERYVNGSWQTQEVQETRVRWEMRVGRLERHYANRTAPALEEHQELERRLGKVNRRDAQPYRPALVAKAVACLPNRPPNDAWPDARANITATARRECQQACRADHMRDFRWSAQYRNKHWTQLLTPFYATYYLDDEQRPHPLLIHGQTGKIDGRHRASMQRAKKASLITGSVAAAIFIISLLLALIGLAAPPLLLLAPIGLLLALAIGLLALLPPFMVWRVNRG